MNTNENKGRVVQLSQYQDIPEGSVRLSRNDVLLYQLKRINEWQPASEVWPLSKGASICACSTVISCVLTNNFFRKHFNLRHHGRTTGYLMAVVMPCVITVLTHTHLITQKVMIGDFSCPTCLMTKSGAMQAACGALYPVLLCPVFCALQAKRFLTAAIEPSRRIGDSVKIIARTAVPFKGFLLISLLSNMAIGMCMSKIEMDTFINVLMKPKSNTVSEEL